jgi:hypothetical protein
MTSPIESLTRLKKTAAERGWFKDKSVVYHGLGPLGAHMWSHFLPISCVIAEYYGEEVPRHIEEAWGAPVYSYEKYKHVRHGTSGLFLEHFYADHEKEILSTLAKTPGDLLMIPFAPSQKLLDFLYRKAPRLQLLQNTVVIQNYFEDKTMLAWRAEEIGIPLPPLASLFPFSSLNYAALRDRYPNGFVIQIPHSQHGGGTDFVFSEADLAKVVEEKRAMLGKAFDRTQVKITPFLSGPSLNCTGSVCNGSVALSPPDIQIVGDPNLVPNPAMYIGSDFTRQGLTAGERQEVLSITGRIGKWLGSQGYRGNFGVDFLTTVDANFKLKEIYVSEVNARLVGESQYMADFEAMNDVVPLTFFHLAEYLELDITADQIEAYNRELPDVKGSAIIIYTKDKGTHRATGGLKSGVYRFDENEKPVRLRDGWTLSDTKTDDEWVLTNGVPWGDLVIGHPRYGDECIALFYIMTRESIVDPVNWRLVSERWRKRIEVVRDAAGLVPCEYRSLKVD